MDKIEKRIEFKKNYMKDYIGDYMKQYIANSETIRCADCGGSYKKYRKYKHLKTQKHMHANRPQIIIPAIIV